MAEIGHYFGTTPSSSLTLESLYPLLTLGALRYRVDNLAGLGQSATNAYVRITDNRKKQAKLGIEKPKRKTETSVRDRNEDRRMETHSYRGI
jgi:hypothetical protein